MQRAKGTYTLLLITALIGAGILLHGQNNQSRTFHVSGQQLPGSLTSPTPIEGIALTTSVAVDSIVISNTDSVAHTVTIEDCQGTPFILYNAYSIPATTTWFTGPMAGTRFTGCIKWSASDTHVMGTIVGGR